MTVIPGITNQENVYIADQVVNYSWVVTKNTFTDQYTIELQATFQTNVPAPVVTMAVSDIPTLAVGQSGDLTLTLTNNGLVAAQNVLFTVPSDPQYSFTPAIPGNASGQYVIGAIAANSTVTIPITVTNNGGTGPYCHLLFSGTYQFEAAGTTPTTVVEPMYAATAVPNRTCNLTTLPPISGPTTIYVPGGPPELPGGYNPPPIVNETVDATVGITLDQTAALTATEFTGTLDLQDNLPQSLTDVGVNLSVTDANGNPVSGAFFIQPPTLSGISAVDGTGTLAGNSEGSATYEFIPTNTAAPTAPTIYNIGGTLTYLDPTTGQQVTVQLYPGTITVYPQAKITLNYFLQSNVFGTDPNNPREPSEPFDLGLLATNIGYGAADDFTITSSQPQITSNATGLLIDFAVIGTQVGSNQESPSLTADLGDLDPGQTESAVFVMTSSLEGEFTSFDATYSHTTALGGSETSQIVSVDAHTLIHTVQTTGDGELDFLAADSSSDSANGVPDTLYQSNGNVAPVSIASSITTNGSPASGQVTITATEVGGWNYIQTSNPGAGYELTKVVGPDGTVLNPNNYWTTDRVFQNGVATYDNQLHIFDSSASGGAASYTLYYTPVKSTVVATAPNEPYTAAPYDNGSTTVTDSNGNPITDGLITYAYYDAGNFSVPLAGAPTAVGSYDLIASFSGDQNFAPETSQPVPFSIIKAPLSVTANNASISLGQPIPTLTGTVNGLLGTDAQNVTIHFISAATSSSPAGTYTIAATYSDPDQLLGNYALTFTPGTLTIGKSTPTVSLPQTFSATYDGASDYTSQLKATLTGAAGEPAPTARQRSPSIPAAPPPEPLLPRLRSTPEPIPCSPLIPATQTTRHRAAR